MSTDTVGHAIELKREINATPTAVWTVLADIDSAAQTLSGVDSIERLSPAGYEVGTRWRETRTMFGKAATEEMYVTAVEADQRTVIEADSSGVHYTTVFTLQPRGDGTLLTMSFTGEQVGARGIQKLMWKLFGKLGLKAASKVMRQDLDDIARAAEAR